MTNLESYNCAKRKGLKHSKVLVWTGICQAMGPKLTFLGRRQLVTKNFFSVARWKNVVAKKSQ